MKKKLIPLLLICSMLFINACSKSLMSKDSNALLFKEPIQNIAIMHQVNGLYGPCEPSIAVSPVDQSIVLAGTVLNNVHLSNDGGQTWQNKILESSHGVYGDPVTIFDKKGMMYYAHLSNPQKLDDDWLDRIVVQTSEDGNTFSDGSSPKGNRSKDQDKHWLYASPLDNTVLMSWTEFDLYGSKKSEDRSRILFSSSQDQGKTWSDALPISEYEGDCIDDDKTTEGAVPCVGIDGTFYVVWSYKEKIYLDYSLDKGRTWQQKDQILADQLGGWSFDIPGISRCNGMPVLKIDHSNGPYHGHLYVSWADQSKGSNDTNIWFIKSSDNGKTWSIPAMVNNDQSGKHQFFSWMDIDQSNGNIYWVFYDRRAYQDEQTDVYLAYSKNGGNQIVNQKISTSPFIPNKEVFFGDYNDISAVNGTIRPIWTRLEKGKLSVWTAILQTK